jgi:hypothetical protein
VAGEHGLTWRGGQRSDHAIKRATARFGAGALCASVLARGEWGELLREQVLHGGGDEDAGVSARAVGDGFEALGVEAAADAVGVAGFGASSVPLHLWVVGGRWGSVPLHLWVVDGRWAHGLSVG